MLSCPAAVLPITDREVLPLSKIGGKGIPALIKKDVPPAVAVPPSLTQQSSVGVIFYLKNITKKENILKLIN